MKLIKLTDNELMMAVGNGQPEALGFLFQRHHKMLYNYFRRLVGDSSISEDLVQETFSRMLKYAHTFRGDGVFLAWFFNIGRNASIDYREPLKIVKTHCFS